MSFLILEKILRPEKKPDEFVPLYCRHRTHILTLALLTTVAGIIGKSPLVIFPVAIMLIQILVFRRDERHFRDRDQVLKANVNSIPVEAPIPHSKQMQKMPSESSNTKNQSEQPFVILDVSRVSKDVAPLLELPVHSRETMSEFLSDVAAKTNCGFTSKQFGQTWIICDAEGLPVDELSRSDKLLSTTGIQDRSTLVVRTRTSSAT